MACSIPRRGGIAGYQIFRGGFEVGGDQWDPVAVVVTVASPRLVVAYQDLLERLAGHLPPAPGRDPNGRRSDTPYSTMLPARMPTLSNRQRLLGEE